MKILITGGSGFLGSHVADELTKKGHKVTIFDIKKSKWINNKQNFIKGNIRDLKKLSSAIKGKDIIYHFAALADLDEAKKKPVETIEVNVLGTANLLRLSKKHKIKKFIYASTIYVVSEDGGFYRCSKKASEDYIEEFQKTYGLNYIILRFGSLYGPRADKNNGVKKLIQRAIKYKKLSYEGSRNAIREYINVKDAAKISAEILKKKFINQHLILTGKKKIKVKFLLSSLAKILKIKKKISFYEKDYTGHYVKTPYTYKPKMGKKVFSSSHRNFLSDLKKLAEELKINV
jgi:UDP-glucose 4-epimerase